jgi:dTDP-4-amino-4,6-dideoxygalactose transaminase
MMQAQHRIPFNRPFIAGKELYYISRAVIEGRLSGDGLFTQKCHSWLEQTLNCKRAFLTHSCTAALEMAAILCGIRLGDEVIMPSFTFVSTANAFVLRGGVPVFVDIRQDTLNMDEKLIQKAITDRTKAIVPVHYAGVACAMDEIMEMADRYKLWVIEDAAQAFLSTHNGKYLGSIGHLGCLSFHETKNIISGEGGALLVNDPEMIERAEIIREKGTNRNQFFRGQVDKYTWVDIGSSFLPSELVGAFLYAQLEQAEKIIAARKRIFERYMQGLKPLADKRLVRLPFVQDESACNGHIFYIITKSLDERTRLIAHLKERGINAVFHYVPLHSSPAGKKYGKTGSAMTVTDDLSDKVLRLPLYYEMTNEDVDRVVDTLSEIIGRFEAHT